MGTVTLVGNVNTTAPSGTPITISGFSVSDVLQVTQIGTGAYLAWLAWNSVTCTDPSGCAANGINRGYLNLFVVDGTRYGTEFVYPTAQNAADAWKSAFPNGIELTGATSYTFWLSDPAKIDNSGGLVLKYLVKPTSALMFSCNS